MTKWRCSVCGNIYEGDSPPEKCPKCASPQEKYEKVSPEQAHLIERSRLSNGLHLKISVLLDKVANLSEEGIKDNLDPGCLDIFTKAKKKATLLKQMIKAENQTHVQKGKWG